MKYIEKKSIAKPITGEIVDTWNVDDKTTNAPSMRLVEEMSGGLPIGSGCDFYGTTAPVNYMFADGTAISRTEYSELFKVIGTIYGEGDGSTTFNLPDKRERMSIAKGEGTFNELGKTGGSETHTQAVNEMPSHNHATATYPASSQQDGWGIIGYYGTRNNSQDYYLYGSNRTEELYRTNNRGGGQPMDIMNPYLVCNYIIKVR